MPDATIPQALDIALQHHRAGALAEAERIYRQVLAIDPNQANALHLLGLIAAQSGQVENAVELFRRALEVDPNFTEAWVHLGNALQALGRGDEAAEMFRRAIRLQPDSADAHHRLGAALKNAGKLDEAAAEYRLAIQYRADFAEAHNNLGVALNDQGKHDDAIAACRRAIECHADFPEAHYNLGNALRDLGQLEEAAAAYRRAVELRPGFARAWNNLGNLLERDGRFAEAAATYRQAIDAQPEYAPFHSNLGGLLKDHGQLDEALACYRRALALPECSAVIHSNFLAALHYAPGTTPAELFAAHCEFDERYAKPLRSTWRPHENTREPDRPLRLGFVSPHFAFHPVGHFLVRCLEHLDRRQFEVVCYSDTPVADEMTARLRRTTTDWRDVAGATDESLAECIRKDRIDILFDLAGHTAGHRLLVFARKPAPIQITWLDYVGTTGLSAMDYIPGDRHEIPAGAERFYRERVLRMPDDYICFDPPPEAPPVGPLPALASGHVTFGSFNIPAKTAPQIVEVWSQILRAVPDSRMVIRNRGFEDLTTHERYLALFRAAGIAESRVTLEGWAPRREVLAGYNEVDIALDTFPYNGGLTTCEAMWMGVPVVTCPGEIFASRHGLTHLSAAGLTDTIAADLDQYVRLAVDLSGDLAALADRRASMRERVAASPLCDGERFARHFATLLRNVWREWVASEGSTR